MLNLNMDKETTEGLQNAAEQAAEKTENFLKRAFHDMAESAKAQHEVDKANFEAVKAESRAQWEEAKLSPKDMQEKIRAERDAQVAEAKERTAAAQARIDAAREARK